MSTCNSMTRKIKAHAVKISIVSFLVFFAVFQLIKFNLTQTDEQTSVMVLEHTGLDIHPAARLVLDADSDDTRSSLNKKQDGHYNNSDKSTDKNRTLWKSLPPGTQMGQHQVDAIKKVIPPDRNLLVWGLGNDSPFWHDTTKGKVIFIEPAGFWFKKITELYPYLEAYSVKYTTETVKSFDKYINNREIWSDLDIRSQLPAIVTQTPWHVIIVDAPPGYKGAPGRYQSIYTSSLLARNGTHIFVDDYERKVEKQFSLKMLGTPIEVVKRTAKGPVGANEQAHFIHITD